MVQGLLGTGAQIDCALGDLVKQMSQYHKGVYYEPKEAKVRESIAVGYCRKIPAG